MGSWFSNLHIRRAENIEPSAVDSALTEMMTAANYLPAENAAEADAAVAILGTDSEWMYIRISLSLANRSSFRTLPGRYRSGCTLMYLA